MIYLATGGVKHKMATWTHAEIDRVHTLVSEKKYSFSEITKILNAEFGTDRSRDSVISVANRYKAVGPSVVVPVERAKKIAETTASRIAKDDGCRYIGDVTKPACGEPLFKKSYCEKHYKICYIIADHIPDAGNMVENVVLTKK